MSSPAPISSVRRRLASDTTRGLLVLLVDTIAAIPLARLLPDLSVRASAVLSFSLLMALFFAMHLAVTSYTFRGLPAEHLHELLARHPESDEQRARRWGLDAMSWVMTGVVVGLASVAGTLVLPELRHRLWAQGLAVGVVVLAWMAMAASAAVALMRLDKRDKALHFPEDADPGAQKVFSDYVYVATQLLSTFSSSDVSICTTAARRTVTKISTAALVFNTVVVALLVSGIMTLIS